VAGSVSRLLLSDAFNAVTLNFPNSKFQNVCSALDIECLKGTDWLRQGAAVNPSWSKVESKVRESGDIGLADFIETVKQKFLEHQLCKCYNYKNSPVKTIKEFKDNNLR
jgi:hypothetical protein